VRGITNLHPSDIECKLFEGTESTDYTPYQKNYINPVTEIYGCCSKESNYTLPAIDDNSLKCEITTQNIAEEQIASYAGCWLISARKDMDFTGSVSSTASSTTTLQNKSATITPTSSSGTYLYTDLPNLAHFNKYYILIDLSITSTSYITFSDSKPVTLSIQYPSSAEAIPVGTFETSASLVKNHQIIIEVNDIETYKNLLNSFTLNFSFYRSTGYSTSYIRYEINHLEFFRTDKTSLDLEDADIVRDYVFGGGTKVTFYNLSLPNYELNGIKNISENDEYNLSDGINNYLCDILNIDKNILIKYIDRFTRTVTDVLTYTVNIEDSEPNLDLLRTRIYFENMDNIPHEIERVSESELIITFEESFSGTIIFTGALLQPLTLVVDADVTIKRVSDFLSPGATYNIKSNLALESIIPNTIQGDFSIRSFYSASKNVNDIRGVITGDFALGTKQSSYTDLVNETKKFGKNYVIVKDALYNILPEKGKTIEKYNVNDIVSLNNSLDEYIQLKGIETFTDTTIEKISKTNLYGSFVVNNVMNTSYSLSSKDHHNGDIIFNVNPVVRLKLSKVLNSSELMVYSIVSELYDSTTETWSAVTTQKIATNTASIDYSPEITYMGEGLFTYTVDGYNHDTYYNTATTLNTLIVNPTTAAITIGTAITIKSANSASTNYTYWTVPSIYNPFAVTYVFEKDNYTDSGDYGYQMSSIVYTYRSLIFYPYLTTISNLHSSGDGSIGTTYLQYINSSGNYVYSYIGKTSTDPGYFDSTASSFSYVFNSIEKTTDGYRLVATNTNNNIYRYGAIVYYANTWSSGTYETAYITATKGYVITNYCNNKNVPVSLQVYAGSQASATAEWVTTLDIKYTELYGDNKSYGVLYADAGHIILLPRDNTNSYRFNDITQLLTLKDAKILHFDLTAKRYLLGVYTEDQLAAIGKKIFHLE